MKLNRDHVKSALMLNSDLLREAETVIDQLEDEIADLTHDLDEARQEIKRLEDERN